MSFVVPANKRKKYTRQRLIADVQSIYRFEQRPLTTDDIKSHHRQGRCADYGTYMKEFPFSIAIFRRANVPTSCRSYRAKEDVLYDMQILCETLGHFPNIEELSAAGCNGQAPDEPTIVKFFGSVGRALDILARRLDIPLEIAAQ